ncbi:IS66 family insertion sequence element accessory protein TnpB [Methylobacterium sp. J-026]|uniref:IS66 family insertion sequence element accessory protein TnpB n=1 Tax=Methylobacterium sp. J-026 TaxID=2836624 RepID=UPI001FBBF003|nr:IS66 family insertion sequence element accessory protein TnpB [Methylobacterium sp. J-026]MCJ2133986.1 IS66 family insertion sequence element accessory protein TnpB [Methylobacterium sp. J-026]
MIGPSGAVHVMMATRPADFRMGLDGLAALARDAMGAGPFSDTVYVFRSKRADRAKLLFWNGSEVVLATKRLEAGQFCWPKIEDGFVRLTAAQLAALFEGLDWKRVHTARTVIAPGLAG